MRAKTVFEQDAMDNCRFVTQQMCNSIAKNAKMSESVMHGMSHVLFDGMMGQAVVSNIKNLKSGTTICKSKLFFDAAYVRACAKESFAVVGGHVRWAWGDSSPQAGRDWFLSKELVAAVSKLLDLSAAMDSLVRSIRFGDQLSDDERHQCDMTLKNHLRIHMRTPQAKGEGHTGVEHLSSCFIFGCYLENLKLETGLEARLDEYASFTSDQGHESGIRSFRVSDLKSLLPPWLKDPRVESLELDVHDVDAHDQGNAVPPAPRERAVLENGLEIAGALHILSNLPKDLSSRLQHWKTHVEKLREFEAFLKYQSSREHFQATCPMTESESSLFDSWSHTLHMERWFEVFFFVRSFVPLAMVMRRAWDHRKYMEGLPVKAREDDHTRGHARKADPVKIARLLEDESFHGYNECVKFIGGLLSSIRFRLEACPCHRDIYSADFGKSGRSSRFKKRFGTPMSCPCGSCHAADLASGCMFEHFEEIANTTELKLGQRLADCCPGLSSDEKQMILADFVAAKLYILLGLRLKFDYWLRLPWLFAGLGNVDPTVRTRVANQCINVFNSMLQDGVPLKSMHPFIIKFLCPGSVLRSQVDAVARGEDMGLELRTEVARLKFIPVCERAAEAPHSLLKRGTQSKFTKPSHQSLAVRSPFIMQRLTNEPSFKSLMVECYGEVKNPNRLASAFGLDRHPEWQKLGRNADTDAKMRVLRTAFYRCDVLSHHLDLVHAKKDHAKSVLREMASLKKLYKKPAPIIAYDGILKKAGVDFFRDTAESYKMFTLRICDGGYIPSCGHLQSALDTSIIQKCKRLKTGVAEEVELLENDLEPDHGSDDESRKDSVLCFRVIHARPSNMRTVRLGCAVGGKVSLNDIAITVHPLLAPYTDDAVCVSFSPHIERGESVFICSDLELCSLGDLRSGLLKWRFSPLQYTVAGLVEGRTRPFIDAINLVRFGETNTSFSTSVYFV